MILTPENRVTLIFMVFGIVGFMLKKRAVRWVVMLTSLAVIGFLQMGCPSPVGALQNVLMHPLDFGATLPFWIKMAIVFLPAFVFGPIFCGWVCPKGVIQELLFRKELKIKIPEKVDVWLRKLPWLILISVILVPVLFHEKVFNNTTSPFKVIFNLMGSPIALAFLIVILFSSLFIYRPFCKYICPIGVILNGISRLGLFRIKPGGDCNACGVCSSKCEMNALKSVQKGEKPVLDKARCIACGECRENCRKGCLNTSGN